jgi:hypothetical protein
MNYGTTFALRKGNSYIMYIKVFNTTCILVVFIASFARSTNAPITTLATVGNVSPGQVSVPITVVNFSNIGAISLTFDYNYSGLTYVSGTPNPSLPGFAINDNNLGNGKHRVIMGWFNTNAVSLSNGSTIMTVNFTYISGNDSLVWYDNGPSCEYADGNGNVLNDIPTSTYYINGFVCGSTGTPGTITGPTSVCTGQTGLVYSINPMTNVTGYSWTVPPGANITNGTNTNSVTVAYSSSSTSGNITVKGVNQCGTSPTSTLTVAVYALPIANAGNDTTILYGTTASLHAASGGTGSFSYSWTPANLLINPNVQDPQTVVLFTTTVFTLVVTNLSSPSCQSSDQVVVSITGGPLTVNPTVYPSTLCVGESAQLYANAGGGSGNYSYSWTCTPPGSPPWTSNNANPVVIPDTSEIYHVSVNDGYNQAVGNTSLSVYQLPTAVISGGDTLCGSGLTTTLTINLTGTPPWFFDYSDGLTTYQVTDQYSTPYLIITGTAGTYTVFDLIDAYCNGTTSGSAVVAVFPIPPTPTISQSGNELISTACCGNQWYKNKVIIPGATGQTLTPGETAHYCDIVTLNSCASDTSNDIYFIIEGINNRLEYGMSIKPNPARGYIQILPDKPLNQATFDFYTTTGQMIKHIQAGAANTGDGYRIDISELSPGLYLIMMTSQELFVSRKLIIE